MTSGTQRLLAFGGIHTAFLLGPLAGCRQRHQALQGREVYKWRILLVSGGGHTAFSSGPPEGCAAAAPGFAGLFSATVRVGSREC